MNISRRSFLESAGAFGALALAGCKCPFCCSGINAKIAVQLYSIGAYINGRKDKGGKVVQNGVGPAKAFEDLAKIGFTGVEFAGYYGLSARELKLMLDQNGLKAVGAHIGGWRDIQGDKLAKLAEFNLQLGNDILICPGGTSPDGMSWSNPKWDAKTPDFMKFIVDFFNERAEAAKKLGCRVGIHNHQWEFQLKDEQGVTFWDHFFSGTVQDVLMEQDVGWTTCAGYDPCEQFRKYPGRSPLLHAKENGMGKDVKEFDAILGRPGKPGAKPVDWDALIPVSEENGTEWYVVECEKHFEDLSAVTPSYAFLKQKGLK